MRLRPNELAAYQERGFIALPAWFDDAEVAALDSEAERSLQSDTEGRVFEDDGITVRAVHGAHLHNEMMRALCSHPKLLEPVRELLNDEVYVHQFKINAKRALVGEVWEWHTDFHYWHTEDGMPQPNALSAAVFLDDVTEFNGPLFVIPGTHKLSFDPGHHDVLDENAPANGGPGWRAHTGKHLKYTIGKELLQSLISQKGVKAMTGPRGSVVLFHCSLFHSSNSNTMPWDRRVIFISYNSVANRLEDRQCPRPPFMASRDFQPLRVNGDALGVHATASLAPMAGAMAESTRERALQPL